MYIAYYAEINTIIAYVCKYVERYIHMYVAILRQFI